MARLFIQFGREEITSCLEDGRGGRLTPGPLITLKAPLVASDRGAWLQVLEPLHSFLLTGHHRPREVVLVPVDVRLEVLTLAKVPKMRPREVLEAHLRVRGGAETGATVIHWRVVPPLPGDGDDTVAFSVISLDAALIRRLREVPAALGCPRASASILPYPVAAASAAQCWGSEKCVGVLDISGRETAMVMAWQGVPVGYHRTDFGVESIIAALCTKLAVAAESTWSLTPEKARQTLATLNLATLDARIAEESIPNIRQILQVLDIALQKFRDDIGGAVDQVDNAFGLVPVTFASWSAGALPGLGEYFRNRISCGFWSSFDPGHLPPGLAVPADAAPLAVAPVVVIAGADPAQAKNAPWTEFSEAREREQRLFGLTERVVGCLGALVIGLTVGHSVNIWLVSRALAVQHTVDKPDEAAVRRPVRLAVARKESAAKLQLLQAQGIDDLTLRRFLIELGGYSYRAVVLDLLDVSVAQPDVEAGSGPAVLLSGNSVNAEQELQEFLRFLTALPSVRDAVFENIEKSTVGSAEKLPCSFRIRLRLKGKP